MLEDRVDRGFTLERLFPDQHLVKDDAETVNIRPSVDTLGPGEFGTEIVRTADDTAVHGKTAVAMMILSNTKVGKQRSTVQPEQDIGRLYVPVNHTAIVGELQRAADTLDDVESFRRRHAGADVAPEVTALHILHGYIEMTVGDADVVDRDDVGVRQGRDYASFVQEPFLVLG